MSATFGVKIYDCTQINLQCFGVTISKGPGQSGYAPGKFLEIVPDGVSWTVHKGADGTITRSATNEPGTKMKVHLMQTSPSNAVFSAMLNKDISAPPGTAAGIGTAVANDTQGTSTFETEACWVEGQPERGYGKEADEVIWTLYCAKNEQFDGGN